MDRDILRDDQWEQIKDHLPGSAHSCGVTAKDNRLFLEAVLWIARTGSPWRDLPERFGHWHRVYVRYNRWSKKGTWAKLAAIAAKDPDLEYLIIDGSVGPCCTAPPLSAINTARHDKKSSRMPHKFNAERRHEIPKQKHRVTNWPQYNEALRQRGDLTIWVSEEALDLWIAAPRNTPGG